MNLLDTLVGPARSLRRKLVLTLTLSITLLWLLAILGTGYVLRHEMNEVFDSALQETAERILPLAVLELIDSDDELDSQSISPITAHDEYLTYVVRDAAGTIRLHSHDADLANFPDLREEGFHDYDQMRIFVRSAVRGNYVIEVAEPKAHRYQATKATFGALVWPIFLLIPLSILGIYWILRRALAPVDRLRAELTARHGADLHPVGTAQLPSELINIAQALNQLFGRLKRTLDAERSFTANSAHELRTPIAASLAQTQRLIAEAPAGALVDRARLIEGQLHRLARLSEKLMQLAKAEGGGVLGGTTQDLGPVLAFVVDDFRRAGQGDHLQLSLPDGGAQPSDMDPDAFGILARNLIENALRHGDPKQPVNVVLAADGTLSVRNAGPIVAPANLAQLTTRFRRGNSGGEGSGLGLAIAETIASGAGARLSLHSPARGRTDGFEAVLHPATSPTSKE